MRPQGSAAMPSTEGAAGLMHREFDASRNTINEMLQDPYLVGLTRGAVSDADAAPVGTRYFERTVHIDDTSAIASARLWMSADNTFELVTLAWIRARFFSTGFLRSFISVALGGAIIAAASAALGAVG